MTSKEALEKLGNEKIVVKGNWKGTIGQEPQYNHLTTFKEHFKNEYATLLQALERLEELEEKLNLGNAVCSGFSHNGKALVLSTLEDYDEIMTRSEKLEKAIEILKCFINYVEVDFDTFVTSQCSDEEQYLLKEVLE